MNEKKLYITNGITQDGFGARLQRALHAMAFTLHLRDTLNINVEYIHTPFTYEGFGENYRMGEQARAVGDNKEPYDEISREGYLKRAKLWDEMIAYNGIKITDINLDKFNIIDSTGKSVKNKIKEQTSNTLFIVKYLQKDFNKNEIDFNIITKYYDEISEKLGFIDKNEKNNDFILHIRRKDAILYRDVRFLEDEYYLDILKLIEPIKDKYNVSIHTQYKNFNKNRYSGWEITYDNEEEDYDLFKTMVNAKVLIMGKSSFSLTAGMLNQNIVIYPQQPTKPLSRWINKRELIKYI